MQGWLFHLKIVLAPESQFSCVEVVKVGVWVFGVVPVAVLVL